MGAQIARTDQRPAQTCSHHQGEAMPCDAIKSCLSLWVPSLAVRPIHDWLAHDTIPLQTHILTCKPETSCLIFLSFPHTYTNFYLSLYVQHATTYVTHTSSLTPPKTYTHITATQTHRETTVPDWLLFHSSLSGVLAAGCPSGSFPSSCFSCGRQASFLSSRVGVKPQTYSRPPPGSLVTWYSAPKQVESLLDYQQEHGSSGQPPTTWAQTHMTIQPLVTQSDYSPLHSSDQLCLDLSCPLEFSCSVSSSFSASGFVTGFQ